MTDFYSEHFSALTGETGHFVTLTTGSLSVPVHDKHARVRRNAARFSVPSAQDLADNDVIRMFDMKSGDRIIDMYHSSDANWGANSTFNIGLYRKNPLNAGTVIDEDLFATAYDISAEVNRVEIFDESTTLDDFDRGQPLWFLANIGDGSYSVDPFEIWTVAFTCSQNIAATDALSENLFEVTYVAGD